MQLLRTELSKVVAIGVVEVLVLHFAFLVPLELLPEGPHESGEGVWQPQQPGHVGLDRILQLHAVRDFTHGLQWNLPF